MCFVFKGDHRLPMDLTIRKLVLELKRMVCSETIAQLQVVNGQEITVFLFYIYVHMSR